MPTAIMKRETAEYIAQLIEQLSTMAREAEIPDIVFALNVAKQTAAESIISLDKKTETPAKKRTETVLGLL